MLAFRLCLATGQVSPDRLLTQLSSRELAEWEAYYQVAPYGQDHTDYLIAQLTALLANVNKGKGGKNATPTDFLPFYKKPQMTPDQIKSTLRSILGGHSRKH